MSSLNRSRGFTLIEVMIVVAILAILAGIAYPSYMESVRKSNRSDAKVELSDIAQRLQRCYTAYTAYNHASCAVATSLKDGGKIVSGEGFYEISATTLTKTSYTLAAAPITGTTQANDNKCTKLTLTHKGQRAAEGAMASECW